MRFEVNQNASEETQMIENTLSDENRNDDLNWLQLGSLAMMGISPLGLLFLLNEKVIGFFGFVTIGPVLWMACLAVLLRVRLN